MREDLWFGFSAFRAGGFGCGGRVRPNGPGEESPCRVVGGAPRIVATRRRSQCGRKRKGDGDLSEQRTGEIELEGGQRRSVAGEDRAQVFDGLPQRIGVRARRSGLPLAQADPQHVQPLAQPPSNPITRFECERQAETFGGRLHRSAGQTPQQELPKQRGRERVARQHVGEMQRKRLAATAALAAIGTKNALAPVHPVRRPRGIMAEEKTVPVQSLALTAAGAALLFEGKSWALSSATSRTKRGGVCGIPVSCPSTQPFVENFRTALWTAGLGSG